MLNKVIFFLLRFFSETKLGHIVFSVFLSVPLQISLCALFFAEKIGYYFPVILITSIMTSFITVLMDDYNETPWL
jgi:hypothetical protein